MRFVISHIDADCTVLILILLEVTQITLEDGRVVRAYTLS